MIRILISTLEPDHASHGSVCGIPTIPPARLRPLDPHEVSDRAQSLNLLDVGVGHAATINDLSDDAVLDAVWWMIDRGRSVLRANSTGKKLLALWRFCCQRGWLTTWPDVELPPAPMRTPVAWTREELALLFSACRNATGFIGGVTASGWWTALTCIQWDTAERIGAIRALKWTDINLRTGWVTFRYETRKGKTRDRTHRLHPETLAVLHSIVEPRREKVFPFPYDRSYFYPLYRKLLRSVGLPTDRKRMTHCVRKSAASWFEAAGGNATVLLDHSSRKVTEESYLDPTIAIRPQASDLLFRPNEPPRAA